MLWIEIARVSIPGLILGILVGKIIADHPKYLRKLNPQLWVNHARKYNKTVWIQIISLSIIFSGILIFTGLGVGKIVVTLWGPLFSKENIFTRIDGFSWILLFISITVLPILEEWIFRGIILEEISQTSQSKSKGLILSSLLFAIFHLSNPGTLPIAIIPYFIGGLIIGGSYLAGGLAVATTSHIIYNLFTLLL